MFCPVCGKQVPDDSKFCEGCGASLIAPVDTAVPAVPQRDPSTELQKPMAEAAPVKSADIPPASPAPPVQPAYAPQPAAAPVFVAPPPYAVAPKQPVYAAAPQPQYVQPMAAPVDDLTKPVGLGGFIGMLILLLIPCVNFIMLLVWAFSSSVNVNKKNLSRAILLLYIIFYVIMIVLMIVFWSVILDNMAQIKDILSQYDISFN